MLQLLFKIHTVWLFPGEAIGRKYLILYAGMSVFQFVNISLDLLYLVYILKRFIDVHTFFYVV